MRKRYGAGEAENGDVRKAPTEAPCRQLQPPLHCLCNTASAQAHMSLLSLPLSQTIATCNPNIIPLTLTPPTKASLRKLTQLCEHTRGEFVEGGGYCLGWCKVFVLVGMEQEVPSAGVRKEVVGVEGESAEGSVVEDGEEVGGEVQYAARVGELTAALQVYSKMAMRVLGGAEEEEEEEEGDVVSESDDVSCGGRIDLADESGYWSRREQTGEKRSFGEVVVGGRASGKRKHEEVDECGLVSESEFDDDTESDDSASSSDSDASDSEYEHWSRKATSNKRRRGGEEIYGCILMTDESLHPRSQEETVHYDNELKEMQQLLELQLQASERRETGMKQRMETMMEMLSKHMGHVEKRVCNLEVGAQPPDQILERINLKLEKVMEGFTTLNENLSILSACLSRGLDSE